jgi:hypothetical protein
MSIHYSFSKLIKEDICVNVFSSFHYGGDFFRYVVTVLTFIGGTFTTHTEKSFSTINKAEGFHKDTVLRLAYGDGFTIQHTSCK